jgi:RNA polymerase sigma factor (sigma-70 family)
MSYYGPGTDDLSFVMLTRDEERELFEKFYAGDVSARDKLITCHLKLVAKLALIYNKRVLPDDEAISVGNLGLIQALESRKFNPALGFRFASHVRWYIKSQICLAMRSIGPLLEKRDHPAGPDWLLFAENATVTGKSAYDAEATPGPRGMGCRGVLHEAETETAVCHAYDAEQRSREDLAAVEEALKFLTKAEQKIIRGYFFGGMIFEDMGDMMGISRQAAWATYKVALAKLKFRLRHYAEEIFTVKPKDQKEQHANI